MIVKQIAQSLKMMAVKLMENTKIPYFQSIFTKRNSAESAGFLEIDVPEFDQKMKGKANEYPDCRR